MGAFWLIVSLPVVAYGIIKLKKLIKEKPQTKSLLAVAGAFAFVLSALKLPSVTGSCSHPTGTGLGAICFGPAIASVLATIVLLFQALFLAHGGLTTLGANVFSMGIVGPGVAYLVFKTCRKVNLGVLIAVLFCCSSGRLGYLCDHINTARTGIPCRSRWVHGIIQDLCNDLCYHPDTSGHL